MMVIYVDTVFFNELKSGFEANGFIDLRMESVAEIGIDFNFKFKNY